MDLDNFSGPGAISAATFTGTDRFAPVRRLGAGGMGVVFEVFDRERDEHVALKTLRHVSGQGLYYLKKEFRSLQGIHHPNLVRLLELIQSGGHWFFTMELIRGRDFLAHVRDEQAARPAGKQRNQDAMADTQLAVPSDELPVVSNPAISPLTEHTSGPVDSSGYDRLRAALHGILNGLTGLHGAGMIHRDIKPSNIMVTRRGRVVLLDFGLAGAMVKRKHLDGESQRMMGTPGYMSPEQYVSSEVSPASDLYSVGVTLYEALTGHLPHSGPVADIMESCKSAPTPPAAVVPHVPARLSDLAMALLQYEPRDRPDIDQVRNALGSTERVRPRLRALTPRPDAERNTGFVGRAEQLATLHEHLDRMLAGHPVSVFLEGVSGIGKTALAREFLRSAEQERGAVVLMGRCYESESVPYKAFDSLIDDLRRYLASLPADTRDQLLPEDIAALQRLFPVLELRPYHAAPTGDAAAPGLRTHAFAALKQLLRRLSRHVDLVVFIDDLQWGDADSAALLREVLRPPDAPTMMFLATYRGDGDGDPLIDHVVREHKRIELSPLTSGDSRELIERMAQSQHLDVDRWAEHIIREGHGSPFFIGEMVRHLDSAPDSAIDAAATQGLLGRVIADRIARLPRQAARLLRAAAVIGRPVSPQFLCAVMEVALGEGLRSIELLTAGNMLRVDRNGDVGVYHDQLREAVVAQLSARKIRDTYKRVRAAIEQSGGDARRAELLGLDYVAETDPARALDHARRAAELAENAFAFDRAARLYALALELCAPDQRRELLQRRATVLHLGGYGAAAAQVYLELAADADPVERVELTRRAADDLLHAGRIDEGLECLAEVATQLGVKIGRSKSRTVWGIAVNRARLALRGLGYKKVTEAECETTELARLDSLFAAATALGIVDHLNGTLMQTQHLLAALAVGEEHRVWRAIAAEVVFLAAQGGRKARRAEKLREQLEQRAEALDDDYLRASARTGAAYLQFFSGRYTEAHVSFDAANKLLLRFPDAWWERNLVRYWDALVLVTIGDFARIAKVLPRLLRAAEERNDRFMLSVLRTHPYMLNCLREDKPDAAEAALDAALDMWTGDRQYVAHYTAMISRVSVRLYRGRPDEALQLLRDAKSLMRQLLVHRLPFINAEVDKLTAVSAIGLGDRRLALRSIRALERVDHPMGHGYGAAYRAGLAFQDDDHDLAVRLLTDALEQFQISGALHDTAAARYRIGQLSPGAEGEQLKAGARAWFAEQRVVDYRRMIDLLTPGFTRD